MNTTSMNVHTDWSTAAFDLPPVADGTGPFAGRDLLLTWWLRRGCDSELLLVESDDALLPLCRNDGHLTFLGEEDLTDYHTPRAATPEAAARLVCDFVTALPVGTTYRFDSLPAPAADAVGAGLVAAGQPGDATQHEVAAVMELPATFDDWLAGIGKRERHEVRRKRRRFEAMLGKPRIERTDDAGAVAVFADMHRRASGDKGSFMTDDMEAFFGELQAKAGGAIDFVYGDAPEPLAAGFGFEDGDAYYLYNSAYEPRVREASPGIVLLAALVESAIGRGLARFDFLKGDEPYKFRHGAVPEPLYVLEGTVGA